MISRCNSFCFLYFISGRIKKKHDVMSNGSETGSTRQAKQEVQEVDLIVNMLKKGEGNS